MSRLEHDNCDTPEGTNNEQGPFLGTACRNTGFQVAIRCPKAYPGGGTMVLGGETLVAAIQILHLPV